VKVQDLVASFRRSTFTLQACNHFCLAWNRWCSCLNVF